MKKIVAINASPRKGWNTDIIVEWTMFNAEDRKMRRETVFQEQCQKAFEAGVRLAAE